MTPNIKWQYKPQNCYYHWHSGVIHHYSAIYTEPSTGTVVLFIITVLFTLSLDFLLFIIIKIFGAQYTKVN